LPHPVNYTVSEKNIPNVFDCNLRNNYQILMIFGTNISETTCHQRPFSFPPHPAFVSALPGENTTSKISLFYPMRYDCLINITRKTHFVHISDTLAGISSSCSFFNCLQEKLLEVFVHYANTGKETPSSFIDSSMDEVLLQTNTGCTGRFLTFQTFLNFI